MEPAAGHEGSGTAKLGCPIAAKVRRRSTNCHSTGVRKNYDAANDRFATAFAEISIGCEPCHAQGSRHVAWAQNRNSWWPPGKIDDPTKGLTERFSERRDANWSLNLQTGNSRRSALPALPSLMPTAHDMPILAGWPYIGPDAGKRRSVN